jgi:Protein of unknown function (DUF4011)
MAFWQLIRVLMTRKELERRLKSINDRASSHLRETGHHTLHLAFGFVQWFEDDESDLPFHAPLLLLPVKLTKDEGRAKKDFRLSVWEGGLEVNVALVEKARSDWGLELPNLRKDETPESYFVRTKAALEQGRRLKLRHYIKHRRLLLSAEWSAIGTVLKPYLRGAEEYCSTSDLSPKQLKAQEDMIDAIICCISAIRALDGGARPLLGDHLSAIWVPFADSEIQARTLLPSSPYSARAEMRREVWHDNMLDDPYLAEVV